MYIKSLNLVADINGDGSYSLWEIWDLLRQIVRVPGNLVVEGLGHIPYVSGWLGINASPATGYGSFNGLLALVLSLLFWAGLLFALMTISSSEEAAPVQGQKGKRWGRLGPTFASQPSAWGRTPKQHTFLPVSRPAYAAHNTTAKRRRHHHPGDSGRRSR
ncbi:hypothetical protein GSY71_10500 [Pusillimonas sp. TS35]|uniref:hypothetical protein n=1 Tax=Paracandidimonas lactea TaxID=2895524 RepID=UPI0013704478|nr:hypothetical protein [Paracandidimonas lactea]MYN13563.1 hypothetical protein [Pusillimonas sp. TS35]